MSWKKNSKIRDLEPYAKRYDYSYVVAFCVHADGGGFTVNTYGQTKQLCKAGAIAGEQLIELVKSAQWPKFPPVEPPELEAKHV